VAKSRTPEDLEAADPNHVLVCALCERRAWPGPESDAEGWLYLEIHLSGPEPIRREFCSPDHAADWFRLPLPDPELEHGEPGKTTAGDRLFQAGCLLLFLWAAATMLIGSWAAVRWLAG
jgi:hypothetical protein